MAIREDSNDTFRLRDDPECERPMSDTFITQRH
jgi:hypothetical protein